MIMRHLVLRVLLLLLLRLRLPLLTVLVVVPLLLPRQRANRVVQLSRQRSGGRSCSVSRFRYLRRACCMPLVATRSQVWQPIMEPVNAKVVAAVGEVAASDAVADEPS